MTRFFAVCVALRLHGALRPLKHRVRAKTVGAKHLQCFREARQIQILCSHLKAKCEHGSVTQAEKQVPLPPAAHPVIDEILNKTRQQGRLPLLPHLGRALMRPRWRSFAAPTIRRRLFSRRKKGGPGGNGRADFLSPFLCSVTKKWHPKPTASAHEVQCERP